ncbi:MAG: heparan-alpha-glucosaminide N-acetyltransferase domain-containing protein, partial [Candidatus Heimdallarchaeota archaeon]
MSEIEVKNNTTSKLYNRYISIDLLRGFAIFIMIILHVISDTLNIDYYIGDEKNVLERFYLSAKKYKINNIIRVTADCPLIDYKIL